MAQSRDAKNDQISYHLDHKNINVLLNTFLSWAYSIISSILRIVCHVLGTLACRYFRVFGPEEKPRERRRACSGLVLCALDSRSFHGTSSQQRCIFSIFSSFKKKTIKSFEVWSLMCPNECPGLQEAWGDKFVELYEGYEKHNKYRKQMPAREVWNKILDSQIETGTPYMLYKGTSLFFSHLHSLFAS